MSGEYNSHNCTFANDSTISVKLFSHINEHLNSSEQNVQCVCGSAVSCSKDTPLRLQPILWNDGIKLSSILDFTFSLIGTRATVQTAPEHTKQYNAW